jgi:hypothetical protein
VPVRSARSGACVHTRNPAPDALGTRFDAPEELIEDLLGHLIAARLWLELDGALERSPSNLCLREALESEDRRDVAGPPRQTPGAVASADEGE